MEARDAGHAEHLIRGQVDHQGHLLTCASRVAAACFVPHTLTSPPWGVDRLTFFVPGSVELGLQAFGVLFVIVLCVGCVLAVAAGREVAVVGARRAGRAGSRIPQLGAYEWPRCR